MKIPYIITIPMMLLASVPSLWGDVPSKVAPLESVHTHKVRHTAHPSPDASSGVIHQPEGNAKQYVGSNITYMKYYYWTYSFADAGIASEIVFDQDSQNVYIKDPISAVITNTYISGTYTDSKMSFTFPQIIIEDNGSPYYVHRMVYDEHNSHTDDPVYTIDDSQPVTFTIDADGTITCNLTDEKVIIGMTDENDEWLGYGNYNMRYEPFEKELLRITDMPADFASTLQNWCIIGKTSQDVKVSHYGDKCYIAGLDADNEDALVVGAIDGNTVTIESGQYLGIDPDYNYYKYFYGFTVESSDVFFGNTYKFDPIVTFTLNDDRDMLTCENDGFGIFGGNLNDQDMVESYSIHEGSRIQLIPDNISLQPKPAYDLEFYSEDGISMLYFSFDAQNIDGWTLNPNYLYYRVYIGNDIFTLTPDTYCGIDSELTDIGYSQEILDADGAYDVSAEETRYIYFYSAVENPGIQTVYKYNDEEYVSRIVYANGQTDLRTIAAPEPAEATYSDLMGRPIANPAGGIYLRTVRTANGTIKTDKIML
jgi:hypothetical protein